MAQGKGYKSYIVMDWEDTYGTSPSSATGVKIPFNTCDLKVSQPNQRANTITGNRSSTKPFRGNKDVAGTIVVPVDTQAIGIWLKALLGAPSTTGSVSPYTHSFYEKDILSSFLLDVAHPDLTLYYLYNGLKVNTFAMTVGGDGELIATIGVSGSKETKGASAYDGTPSEDFSGMLPGRFEVFECALKEAGSSISYLTEISLDINNNLAPAYCIGDAGIKSSLVEGIIGLTGSITGLFQDDALLLKGRNQTETSLTVTFTQGTYSLEIEFDEVVLSYDRPAISGPEGLLVNLTWDAFYENGASSHAITATLINSVASYL